MESDQESKGRETALIARNVRTARVHQGLSQTQLAHRAGVDLASVYRVEKGMVARANTLKKIATGLNIIYEDLLIDKIRTDVAGGFAVHRAERAKWFAGEDRRQRIPSDQDALVQDVAERRRLGRLGLVPWFMSPPLVIPENGPGIVLIEIYGERPESFNSEFYEDGALYLLSGGASVSVGGASVELSEGDWVAFKTRELTRIAVVPPHEVAVALWIGATRITRRVGSSSEA